MALSRSAFAALKELKGDVLDPASVRIAGVLKSSGNILLEGMLHRSGRDKLVIIQRYENVAKFTDADIRTLVARINTLQNVTTSLRLPFKGTFTSYHQTGVDVCVVFEAVAQLESFSVSKFERFSSKQCMLLEMQLATFVADLHAANLVHGEINPDLFLLHYGTNPTLYALDVGPYRQHTAATVDSAREAKQQQQQQQLQQQSLTPTNSSIYHAPELTGERTGAAPQPPTAAADVYAVAVILLELELRKRLGKSDDLIKECGRVTDLKLQRMLVRCMSLRPSVRPTAADCWLLFVKRTRQHSQQQLLQQQQRRQQQQQQRQRRKRRQRLQLPR